MTFLLYTIWFIVVAVIVNLVMERLWTRISMPFRDEAGQVNLAQPKHRNTR